MATHDALESEVEAVIAEIVKEHHIVAEDDVYAEDGPYGDPVTVGLGSVRDFVAEVLATRSRLQHAR